MNHYSMSDKAILSDLGGRLKSLRIRRNITQESLAQMTLLSLGTIKSLEVGKAKLSTIVAVLRELDALHELDSFIPQTHISPIEIASRKTPERVRAGRRPVDTEAKVVAESDW